MHKVRLSVEDNRYTAHSSFAAAIIGHSVELAPA